MSGGSWDYLYHQVEEAGGRCSTSDDPLRRAFGRHLRLVAIALHDIEWVDSGDTGPGDDRESIAAALGKDARALEIQEATIEAKRVAEKLEALLSDAPSIGKKHNGPGTRERRAAG